MGIQGILNDLKSYIDAVEGQSDMKDLFHGTTYYFNEIDVKMRNGYDLF